METEKTSERVLEKKHFSNSLFQTESNVNHDRNKVLKNKIDSIRKSTKPDNVFNVGAKGIFDPKVFQHNQ